MPIELAVYDHEKSGKHVLMGRLETSVSALVDIGKSGVTRPMLLKKKGKDTGTLFVTKAEVSGASSNSSVQPPTTQMASASISSSPRAPMVVQSTPATAANSAGVATATSFVPMASPAPATAFVPHPSTASSHRSGVASKDMFVDYISGGCELNVAVAIDFTGSNGDPRKPGKYCTFEVFCSFESL